jgi:UDP-N-acetylglucosamine:LPS N-acetylglucosamine transferase
LQDSNAARLILQDELTGATLAKEIAELINDPDEITRREQASRKLAKPDAAGATVDLIERLVSSKQ